MSINVHLTATITSASGGKEKIYANLMQTPTSVTYKILNQTGNEIDAYVKWVRSLDIPVEVESIKTPDYMFEEAVANGKELPPAFIEYVFDRREFHIEQLTKWIKDMESKNARLEWFAM